MVCDWGCSFWSTWAEYGKEWIPQRKMEIPQQLLSSASQHTFLLFPEEILTVQVEQGCWSKEEFVLILTSKMNYDSKPYSFSSMIGLGVVICSSPNHQEIQQKCAEKSNLERCALLEKRYGMVLLLFYLLSLFLLGIWMWCQGGSSHTVTVRQWAWGCIWTPPPKVVDQKNRNFLDTW